MRSGVSRVLKMTKDEADDVIQGKNNCNLV